MKRKIAYLVLIFCILAIIVILIKYTFNNNVKIKYNELKFVNINVGDAKLKRYNELINISQIQVLLRDLPSVLIEDELNEQNAIVYSYLFAQIFKDDCEKYTLIENDNIYMKQEYVKKIIYEMFERKVELSYYREENNYLLINTNNISKDESTLKINNIAYNEKYNIYSVEIQEYYGQYQGNVIKIIYKYENEKYTLLWCVSEKIGE